MDGLALTDVFLRGAAVMAMALVAVVFLLSGRGRKVVSVAALAVGMMAYTLVSTPNLPFDSGAISAGLVMIAGLGPVLIYWAGVELFLDRVVFTWWQWGIAALVVGFAWTAPYLPFVGAARGVLVLLVYGHLLWLVLRSDPGDLIEGRRRFRRWFLAAMAVLAAGIGVVELAGWDAALPGFLFVLHGLGMLVLTLAFLIWAVGLRGDIWVVEPAAAPAVPAVDRAVLAQLEAAMADGVWRQEGLTIGKLAAQLEVPEHRLRRVINQGLGHRNFAAFINGPRIAAAQAVLGDPSEATTPVLTIAYDVGFASIGPFNRSFREVTGESPTQYRARVLGG